MSRASPVGRPPSTGCHDRAVLLYEYVGKRIVDLQHTEVPDAYRGRGIAKHLAKVGGGGAALSLGSTVALGGRPRPVSWPECGRRHLASRLQPGAGGCPAALCPPPAPLRWRVWARARGCVELGPRGHRHLL